MIFPPLEIPPSTLPHAREQLLAIDLEATALATSILASSPSPHTLRMRALTYYEQNLAWLARVNSLLANALELDPRLCAVNQMLAAASDGKQGSRLMFLHDYRRLLQEQAEARITSRKTNQKVPA